MPESGSPFKNNSKFSPEQQLPCCAETLITGPKMVNKKISDACYPITVKMGKDMKNGILVLNVTHGKEMEVEYEKKNIMEKINSFFGYSCISKIILKISQYKKNKQIRVLPKIKDIDMIESKINKVNDKHLKSSLNNFLKAYNEKSK